MKGEAHEKTGATTTERKTAKTASRKTATRGVAFADFISEAVPGLRRDCPSGGEKDLRKMCRQTQENRGAMVYALWKKAAGGGAVLSGMSGEGKVLCPGAGAI